MLKENSYRLGLDLGTSSIGVAVYRTGEEGEILSLEHLDSYIFGEPVAPKEMVTLNTGRRSARLIRRQVERKAARLKKIEHIAKSLGVTKNDSMNDRHDVIELRALAVEKKITLPQLIRVFCHIVKNRGYKGTISDGKVDKKLKTTKEFLSGNKTLGQFLWEEKQKAGKRRPWRKIEEDGTFIYRSMVEKEFERIWQEQLKYYPQLGGNYGVWGDNMFPDYPNQKEIPLHDACSADLHAVCLACGIGRGYQRVSAHCLCVHRSAPYCRHPSSEGQVVGLPLWYGHGCCAAVHGKPGQRTGYRH